MAVRIKQQITGLDVSMEQLSRVHVLERLEQLVQYILLVDVF